MIPKVFVVTGANKGIGYGIVEKLLQTLDSGVVYLTARNVELGKKAVESLSSLVKPGKNDLLFHQLDITDESSVKTFADHLKKEHDGLDVLINNAGFSFGFESTEPADVQAKVTIGINYYGTKLVSSHLIPLIRSGGRVVNVCSERGTTLGVYDQRHIDKLKNAKDESEIEEFLDEFKRCAKDDTKKENGFPESAYRVSKAAEIALTMIQHQRHKDLIINACCPGFVATDLTKHRGYLTIQEGADTPVYLATHEGVPNGEFLYQLKVFVW